jgi:hypothetical protein
MHDQESWSAYAQSKSFSSVQITVSAQIDDLSIIFPLFFCARNSLPAICIKTAFQKAATTPSSQKSAGQDFAPHCLSRDFGNNMVKTDRLSNNQIGLVSSGCPCRPVFLVALAAVNRSCSVRLEGNLGLLPTFGASYICHFSWTAIVAASAATAVFIFSFKHLIHLPFVSI